MLNAVNKLARCLAQATLICLLALMLYTAPVVLDADTSLAVAQDKKKDKDEKRFKGKKVQSLGKKVYDAVESANEAIDKNDYPAARKNVERAKAFAKLTPYETAQLHYLSGFLYYNTEKYAQAIGEFEVVLKQQDIPEGLRFDTIKTLAQLKMAVEDYAGSVRYARQYMDEAGEDPDIYALIAIAEYQKQISGLGQGKKLPAPDRIIQPLEKGIALADERGTATKENWWLILRLAYWEKENYRKVREILELLVVRWPKKEYWTQLSGIYYELKDEPRQLAAYEAAFDQGLLGRSSELVQMAQLFMQADVPYKGGKVLEKGLADGTVEKNVRNYRLLSQAWQLAQEDRRAVAPLLEAARMSDDGDLYARLAQSYYNLSEYKSCVDSSRKAIEKGKLKYPGNTWLILGMCQFESKSLSAARKSFQSAARFEKAVSDARNWIKYVDNELARVRQLQESLENLRRARAEAAADS